MPLVKSVVGASDAWITPGLVASVSALFFTIGSFWWIQVRRGRLHSYPPQVYAAAFGPHKIMIVLPLVIHNPAPAPLAVVGLRLRVDLPDAKRRDAAASVDAVALPKIMPWIACRDDVYSDSRTYNAPFAVGGRGMVEKFVEFQWDGPPTTLADGPYVVTVEVRAAPRRWWQKDRWRQLLQFDLNTHLSTESRASFLTRTNDLEFTGPATRVWEGQ